MVGSLLNIYRYAERIRISWKTHIFAENVHLALDPGSKLLLGEGENESRRWGCGCMWKPTPRLCPHSPRALSGFSDIILGLTNKIARKHELQNTVVRDVMPCNLIRIHRRFRRKLFPASSEYSMTDHSSEMSENTRLWLHILEGSNLHSRHREVTELEKMEVIV